MNIEAEQALRAVAQHLSASREDLQHIALTLETSPVPTVGEFAPLASTLLSGRTLETYRHHIDRLVATFEDRRMDEVSLLDLETVAAQVRADAVSVRGARHGFGAQESFVNASRFVFQCAVKAGHLRDNPASGWSGPGGAAHPAGPCPPSSCGRSSTRRWPPAATLSWTC